MKVRRLKLTEDQKARGVVFSSQLMNADKSDVASIHEVNENDENVERRISLLKDTSFFETGPNDPVQCPWTINEIREG